MRLAICIAIAVAIAMGCQSLVHAAPYASGVRVTGGTNVSFVLNEPADWLAYRIRGGSLQYLDGSSRGTKSFALGTANDSFSIIAEKTDSVGYTIPTGGLIQRATLGLSRPTAEAGFGLISDPTNPLTRFNAPRSVAVNTNPNSPEFGTAYIGNKRPGEVPASGGLPARRLVGDGLYALRADGSDAFGYGDRGMNPRLPGGNLPAFGGDNSATPYTMFIGEDDFIYASDWDEVRGNLYLIDPQLTSAMNILGGFGNPSSGPDRSNHGSISASYVEGTIAERNLVVYTVDEDITTNYLTGAGANSDVNSLWRYDILGGDLPSDVAPVRVNKEQVLTSSFVRTDLERGADGKFYLSQYRNFPTSIAVLDANGNVLQRSFDASVAVNGGRGPDLLNNVNGIAVSADQKWLAAILRNSDIAVIRLIHGFLDLASLRIVNTGPDADSAGDLAFDAAGNLHFTSNGQALYGVIAPGGTTMATTVYDGTSFTFSISTVPEPAGRCALIIAMVSATRLRRRTA